MVYFKPKWYAIEQMTGELNYYIDGMKGKVELFTKYW
jgi:hypothetical protein